MKLYIAERKIKSFEAYKEKKALVKEKVIIRQSWIDNWEIKYQK